MKWIVQEMLPSNTNIPRMIKALKNANIEYLLVRIEEDGELTLLNNDDGFPIEGKSACLKDFTKEKEVIVYGSKKMAEIAVKEKWNPGSFSNEKFEYDRIENVLGREMLNSDFVSGKLWDLEPTEDVFFMRPLGNNKLFNGGVFNRKKLDEMKKIENPEKSRFAEHSIVISSMKEIKSEYRFFVIDGKIVTGSSYRKNNVLNTSIKVSERLLKYTKDIVDRFWIADAYVIDIADTSEGFKVVEYNNFNTSGLYGCDENKIVKAMEKGEFKNEN